MSVSLGSTRTPPRRSRETHARLQVDQDGSRDRSRVVALVVENVLAVAALGGNVLEVAALADAVFLAELLPKLTSDCVRRVSVVRPGRQSSLTLTAVAALAGLDRDDFSKSTRQNAPPNTAEVATVSSTRHRVVEATGRVRGQADVSAHKEADGKADGGRRGWWVDSGPMAEVRCPVQAWARIHGRRSERGRRASPAGLRDDVMEGLQGRCLIGGLPLAKLLCNYRWPTVDLERGPARRVDASIGAWPTLTASNLPKTCLFLAG